MNSDSHSKLLTFFAYLIILGGCKMHLNMQCKNDDKKMSPKVHVRNLGDIFH